MAFFDISDTYLTWVNFFDANNKKLVELLNQLHTFTRQQNPDEKIVMEQVRTFKKFYEWVQTEVEPRLVKEKYPDIEYRTYVKKLFKAEVDKILVWVPTYWFKSMTLDKFNELKSILSQTMYLDKHAVIHLKKKYWEAVDDIIIFWGM